MFLLADKDLKLSFFINQFLFASELKFFVFFSMIIIFMIVKKRYKT